MAKTRQAYEVRDALDYDGKRYERGAIAQIDDEAAAELLRIGVVAKAGEAAAAGGGDDGTDWAGMTVPQLTEHLESIEIDIPKGAKKDDLIALCVEAAKRQ